MDSKGYYGILHINLPDYMMDENNKEWENMRAWRKDTLEAIKNGKNAGFAYPSHPDVKVWIETEGENK